MPIIEVNGRNLLTIGYGLEAVKETDPRFGYGLKLTACCGVKCGEAVTQYEGEILSPSQARVIHELNPYHATHFATAVPGGQVIDGFRYCPPHEIKTCDSEMRASRLRLPFQEFKGKGGGSLSNNDLINPNCCLQSMQGPLCNGTELLLVATRDIMPGEFIYVSYSKGFLSSKLSNIWE